MADKRTGKVIVPFEGDTKKLETGIDEAKKKIDGLGSTSGFGKLNDAFKQITGSGISATAALGALATGFRFVLNEAMGDEVIMKQTQAVIEATGGVAGMTADAVANLAEQQRMLTGIDDDAIQTGENMLLTFKNIGGDVFPRATKAMEDMAVAMNGGITEGINLKDTAIQLGKALNDPTVGLSALARVGVTFTDSQKDAIKAMQAAGDTAGAQAVILKELESEFGGAAEAAGNTLAGQMDKLEYAFKGVASTLGEKTIPVLTQAAETLNLLVSGNAMVTDALAEHDKEVLMSSKTYSSYVTEMIRAYDVSNTLTATQKMMIDQMQMGNLTAEESNAVYQRLAEEIGLTSESYFDAVHMVDADNEAVKRFNQTASNTGALKDLNDKLYDQAAAAKEAADGTWTANDAMKAYSERMLFTAAAANLDSDAQFQLAYQMGLIDEKTVTAHDKMAEYQKLLDTGQIDVATYKDLVAGLADALDRIQDKSVIVNIDTYYNEHHGVPSPGSTGTGAGPGRGQVAKPTASGGYRNPGEPILWQESGFEMASFPNGGFVWPANVTSQILSKGLINTTINQVVSMDTSDSNKLLEDMLDRLTSLERKAFTREELVSGLAEQIARL